MNLRPLHDRLIVKRLAEAEKTAGGIIIPDSSKEKPVEGEVLAIGDGVRDTAGNVHPLAVKVGDKVMFGKWGGTEIKVDGEELLIMKEEDVLAIIQ